MLHEVKSEIVELVTNLAFARNLSLSMVAIVFGLHGLAELQGQDLLLTQPNLVTNVSNSSAPKLIIDREH